MAAMSIEAKEAINVAPAVAARHDDDDRETVSSTADAANKMPKRLRSLAAVVNPPCGSKVEFKDAKDNEQQSPTARRRRKS